MDKIVGKFYSMSGRAVLFTLLLSTFFVHAADLELSALSMRGRPIDAIGMGEPFVLQVSLKDVSGRMPAPILPENQSFTINSTQQSFMIINGQRAYQYRYVVHMNEQGEHLVGPATIIHHGATITSNTITLEVDESIESTKGQEAFLRFAVDKDSAVVGEKINCILTFYYAKDTIDPKSIEPPRFANARLIGDLEHHTSGTEKINGRRYYYVRWQWELYPEASGTLVIPASKAEYEIETRRGHGMPFTLFSRADRKRIYSNAVQIEVSPLPPCKEQISAVGEFKSIQASITPTVAKVGDALVLTLAIEGSGDLGGLATPQLEHMPDSLRYYESKKYIEPATKSTLPIKKFEYIIQGLQEGDWTIPTQTFVYFDTSSRMYKKLMTMPLGITILPNAAMHVIQEENDIEGRTVEDHEEQIEEEILPLDESDKWYSVGERNSLPWWLFFLLFLIPFYYVTFVFFRFMMRRSYAKNMHAIRAKNAFKLARAALDKARSNSDTAQVYIIIRQVFADRCCVTPSDVTQQFIIDRLRNANMSTHFINQWDDFFCVVSRQMFGDAHQNSDKLFNDAQQWLLLLEGIL